MRGGMAPPTSEVAELVEWLGKFHPKGVVDLDYGGAVRSLLATRLLRLDEDELPFDEGRAALPRAREAPRRGNPERASAAQRYVYRRTKRADFLPCAW